MKFEAQTDILNKWDLYTQSQKEAILSEFRKKHPDDYYCKETFFEFLGEKLYETTERKKISFPKR